FSIKLRRSATLGFAFDKISRLDKFAALAASIACSLFDDLRAFLVQKLMTTVGAEKLDLLVPQFLPVTIKLAVALRAGHPKNLRGAFFPSLLSGPRRELRRDAGPAWWRR